LFFDSTANENTHTPIAQVFFSMDLKKQTRFDAQHQSGPWDHAAN